MPRQLLPSAIYATPPIRAEDNSRRYRPPTLRAARHYNIRGRADASTRRRLPPTGTASRRRQAAYAPTPPNSFCMDTALLADNTPTARAVTPATDRQPRQP